MHWPTPLYLCVRAFFLGPKPSQVFDIVYYVELDLSVAT